MAISPTATPVAPSPANFADFFSQKAKDTMATTDFKYNFKCNINIQASVDYAAAGVQASIGPVKVKTEDVEVKVEEVDVEVDMAPVVVNDSAHKFESACAGLAESSLEMPPAHLAFLESVQQQLHPNTTHPLPNLHDDDYDFEDEDEDDLLDRGNDLLSALDDLVEDCGDGDLVACGECEFGSDIELDLGSPPSSTPSSPGCADIEHQVLVIASHPVCGGGRTKCSNCSTLLLAHHKFCCECGTKA